MNIVKKIYCRIFQKAFRAALPILPYREPEILESTDVIGNKIRSIGVLEEYGDAIHKKLYELAVAAGIAKKEDCNKSAAEKFVSTVKELNKRMSIPERLSGINKEDISKMAYYADKEANPLYPVPKLMDKSELEKFYYKVAEWR